MGARQGGGPESGRIVIPNETELNRLVELAAEASNISHEDSTRNWVSQADARERAARFAVSAVAHAVSEECFAGFHETLQERLPAIGKHIRALEGAAVAAKTDAARVRQELENAVKAFDAQCADIHATKEALRVAVESAGKLSRQVADDARLLKEEKRAHSAASAELTVLHGAHDTIRAKYDAARQELHDLREHKYASDAYLEKDTIQALMTACARLIGLACDAGMIDRVRPILAELSGGPPTPLEAEVVARAAGRVAFVHLLPEHTL